MARTLGCTACRSRPLVIVMLIAAWAPVGLLAAPGETVRPGITQGGRGQDDAGSLLSEYFRRFLDDRDFEAFRDRVARATAKRPCAGS